MVKADGVSRWESRRSISDANVDEKGKEEWRIVKREAALKYSGPSRRHTERRSNMPSEA